MAGQELHMVSPELLVSPELRSVPGNFPCKSDHDGTLRAPGWPGQGHRIKVAVLRSLGKLGFVQQRADTEALGHLREEPQMVRRDRLRLSSTSRIFRTHAWSVPADIR